MCHPVKNLICLTVWHISVLVWPQRDSRKMQYILYGHLHACSQHLKICREAKRDWHNFSRSRSHGWAKTLSVLFTPMNLGILWQVQSLDKHGFLPAAEIKVVCLEEDGRDRLGGSFPHRQGTWQLRSGARHITALKISLAFDAPSQSGYTICACQN